MEVRGKLQCYQMSGVDSGIFLYEKTSLFCFLHFHLIAWFLQSSLVLWVWWRRGHSLKEVCVLNCILLSLDNDVRKVGSLAGSSVFRMYLSNLSPTCPHRSLVSAHSGDLDRAL